MVHKIINSDGTRNLCDGTNKGDYHSDWLKVTCQRCLEDAIMSCKPGSTHRHAFDCLEEQFKKIEAERDRYKGALENIKEHMRIAGGSIHKLSAIWNIAQAALEDK